MRTIRLVGGHLALVDDDDYELLAQYSWYLSNDGYATSSTCGNKFYMHRDVGPAPDRGMVVHHKDGNKLNNQKINLTVVSRSVNTHSTKLEAKSGSGYFGVFPSTTGKFIARLKKDGQRHYLGTFSDVKEAALAVNKKSLELFGEHARQNAL